MLKIVLYLLAVLALGLCANPAQADERYVFDKKHTSISFSVSRLGVFHVRGDFKDYEGEFVFCIRHPDKDFVTITLYPAGLHTGDGEMDETLQGPDFFDAAQFPRGRFVSSTVKLLDKDNATIAGQLTVLGVTKPFTLDVHFKGKEYEPESGDYVVSFTASGIIRRSDFGMSYLTPIIGDEVHLRIQAQGIDRPHVTP